MAPCGIRPLHACSKARPQRPLATALRRDSRAFTLSHPSDERAWRVLLIPFRIGGEHYAVNATSVHLVLPVPMLRRLPGTADWVRGVFLFRGAVMPVVDLCQLTTGKACPERLSSRLLLVGSRADDDAVPAMALLAEGITQALRTDAIALPAPTPDFPGTAYGGRWVSIDETLVQVIDWAALVTPELRALCDAGTRT